MLERTGLTESQVERAAWLTPGDTDSFEPVGGPRAVALFLTVSWQSRLPLLPLRLAPMAWFLDRVYEWIARHRHRFPGMTPWCVSHPDGCGPAFDDRPDDERLH